jgi:DNA polymerase-3 subunit chi
MTNIIFYRIKGDFNSLLLFACKLVNKAYQKKISVLINTSEEGISKKIDEKLWSFDSVSFIPHDIESEPSSTIAINHELNPGRHDQLLINLSDSSTPRWFSRFQKVIEIVYDEQEVINNKRKQYSFYQSRGYPITYHDLTEIN